MGNVIAFKRQAAGAEPDALQNGPATAISKPQGRSSWACTCKTAPGSVCLPCGYYARVQRGIAQRRMSSAWRAR